MPPLTDSFDLGGLRLASGEGRRLDLDVELEVDVAQARSSDKLEHTVDYAAVHARIVRLVSERSFLLLEKLGDAILADLMRDERVLGASVTIAKPKLLAGATPAVRLQSRRRG